MGFKCAIIGLPNVGKSTLFNALTQSNIETANFLFCTIKPNTAIVPVPDNRLNILASIVKTKCIVNTYIKFIDIAGLVKNASKGEGLGNQFLNDIRETDAICHVVRCFEDSNIIHVEGKVNPEKDINIINIELILSDLETCENAIFRIKKKSKKSNNLKKTELIILEKCLDFLEKSKMLRLMDLTKEERNQISYLNFLTMKPTMYIANINEQDSKKNVYLNIVHEIAKKENSIFIPVCVKTESDLNELKVKERILFMNDMGIKETGLTHIIKAGYKLLNLQTYFTVGIKEIRAWSIFVGATALEASGKIHTDFTRGFIRAQIISFNNFILFKGLQNAKENGKIRLEGKNYIVKDGDIINFLFNL